ncbi:putative heme transporter hrg1-A-like [Apostichopus japonicus]|uniref:Putative heme transporter hrg1-A-like n=1 Tax=Stichopus japonicus TaxID=307972 RepID=A0A2G8L286_STIJA|nr:putative heme transporter hrg1-A-like [Apostichopus japonicus]
MNENNMEPGEPSKVMMRCRIGYSCVGIILGISVFICFLATPAFYNLHISLWGFASAFFAFLTMIVHIQHIKGDRDVWVYRLKLFILIGFFTALGCIIAFVVYLVLAIVQKQVLLPVNGDEDTEKGYYLASIWVFMTWKWSFALFLTSRSYRRNYTTRPESNGFLNFILYGNLLFCYPGAITSQPLEEEMA